MPMPKLPINQLRKQIKALPRDQRRTFYHWTTPEAVQNIIGKGEGLKAQAGPDTRAVGNRPGVYVSVRDNNPMLYSRQQPYGWTDAQLAWVPIERDDYNKTVPLEINFPVEDWRNIHHSGPGHITGDSEVRIIYDDIPAQYISKYELPSTWRKRIRGGITPPNWRPGQYLGPWYGKVVEAVKKYAPDRAADAVSSTYKTNPNESLNWDDLYDSADFDKLVQKAAKSFKGDVLRHINEHPSYFKDSDWNNSGKYGAGWVTAGLEQDVPFGKPRPAAEWMPEEMVKFKTGDIAALPYTPEDVARLSLLAELEFPFVIDDGASIFGYERGINLADLPAYRGTRLDKPLDDLWALSDMPQTFEDVFPKQAKILNNEQREKWLNEKSLAWLKAQADKTFVGPRQK